MQTKNNIESSKNKLSKKDLEQLAQKDKEVLEFDAIEDQLQELIFQHKKEAPEISFKKWLEDNSLKYDIKFDKSKKKRIALKKRLKPVVRPSRTYT